MLQKLHFYDALSATTCLMVGGPMRTFFRAFKAISVFTLAFFSWTYLPLFQIAAYAATKQEKTVPIGSNRWSAGPSEKFEKLLEDLREKANKAEDKSGKGEDSSSEIEAIKSHKAEIEALDADLRKDFAATEKKLRDANLPREILNRHNAFVKNYETNLIEFKANIDDIEKAKTPSSLKAEIAKTRTHLEKVKPRKRHVPVNPNKLPHRMVKLKERAPRLKNEEFDKDFPKQRKQNRTGTAFNNWLPGFNKIDRAEISRKPILLAFNDSFTDLPLSTDPAPSASIQQAGNSLLLLAQATPNPPSQADLSETPETQFTPEIRAKAQELGYKPVKIYEWVRNNIDYQPYYGSFKGAQQTLLEGSGNDFDQASLLIALLRVSQIEARYAYGTIEVPVEKVMNWVGGVTDPRMAGAILATKGIPVKLIIVGGVPKYFQLEHVWVEAWINYIPSRGAVHRTGHGDTWIPIDASYKQFTYKQGMDMYALMGFNGEQFLQSYITDTRDITAYQDYGTRLVTYIDTNYPNATIADVFSASDINQTKQIVKQEFPFLIGTLPYKVTAKASQFDELPAALNYSVTIQIDDDSLSNTAGISYTESLSKLADKRITVSYMPATAIDEALVAKYEGNLLSVPPYLINVKPVLKVSGSIVATGAPIGLGQDQNIVISLIGADGDADRIDNIITAGNYSAIVLQSQDTPIQTTSKTISSLLQNVTNLDSTNVTRDDLLGQMLYTIGISYFQKLSFENAVYAKNLQLINYRQPSVAMVTHRIKVDYVFGLPRAVSEGGINIDVDRNINVVASPTQENERIKAFMILSGLSSSAWENRILDAFMNLPSVSAAQLLKLASTRGIPIYTITSANINEVIPQLQVAGEVISDIRNAANAGKVVIISKTNVPYNQWNGVGYIVMDPVTGAAGYMISGNAAGGESMTWQDVIDYWRTFNTRDKAVKIASALKGTPYVWGGASETGTDCSGLVYQAYEGVGLPEHTASDQYDTCDENNWLRDWDQRLPGDIVWKAGKDHTGILAGWNTIPWPPNSTTNVTGLTVIHASGSFKRVIESKIASPTTTDLCCEGLSYFGIPIDKVGRPR